MLGWSINLFRLFGIQLAIHVSFLLLLAYYGWQGWQEAGVLGMGWSIAFIVLFFACVVLHELGHSLTARRYGVRVPRILLLPIGGMAEMDQIPRRPAAELLITIAGPAVNFAIAAIVIPLVWREMIGLVEFEAYSRTDILAHLGWANLVMGTFNLLPVFPMDGGRIFRALLAYRLPYLRATWWAVMVGRGLALILAGLAFFRFDMPMAGVLFMFIFLAAGSEYQALLRRERESHYWAEIARKVREAEAPPGQPPPPAIIHGPN